MTKAVSVEKLTRIPGGGGRAVRLARGRALKLINTHGSQVVDTWALSTADPSEHLSMEQTRRMLFKLWPQQGDRLYSNRRMPMLAMERDTSPGVHDTLFACCDEWVYASYGCLPGHANCRDNFMTAVRAFGIEPPLVPNPLNLWMNIPVHDNLGLEIAHPVTRPGDFVVLRALMSVVLVFSACPMDVTPINGPDRRPRDVHFSMAGRAK